MSRKRIKPKSGDVVAVPLFDGTYGLGHVVFYDYVFIFALFGKRTTRPDELTVDLDDALAQPIAILTLAGDVLRSGEWPVLAFREPTYPSAWLPKFRCEGAESHTATAGPALLAAYHGLTPWDYYKDPKENERLLLPGVPVPATVRYKRDFPPPFGTAPAASPTLAPPVKGPAEIHIAIVYPGKDLPTVEQLRKRQELERRLEEENAGEVTDAGGGEGVMDIYLETDEVQRAMPIVERLVAELGLREDTLVETGPLDDEGEEAAEDDEEEDG